MLNKMAEIIKRKRPLVAPEAKSFSVLSTMLDMLIYYKFEEDYMEYKHFKDFSADIIMEEAEALVDNWRIDDWTKSMYKKVIDDEGQYCDDKEYCDWFQEKREYLIEGFVREMVLESSRDLNKYEAQKIKSVIELVLERKDLTTVFKEESIKKNERITSFYNACIVYNKKMFMAYYKKNTEYIAVKNYLLGKIDYNKIR